MRPIGYDCIFGSDFASVRATETHDAVTTLQEVASVDVGAPSDDLVFSPDGSRLYVSLGTTDAVAVVDTAARKLLTARSATLPSVYKA